MPTISAITKELLQEVTDFLALQLAVAESEKDTHFAHLHWYLFENPHNTENIAGWAVHDDEGKMAGLHMCSFQLSRINGQDVPVTYSNGYYVRDDFRGVWSAVLFQKFTEYAKRSVIAGTTTNALSGRVWRTVKFANQCAGSDQEYLLPLRFGPLLSEALQKKGVPSFVATIARHLPIPQRWLWQTTVRGSLVTIQSASELLSLLPDDPKDHWSRDESWLQWRLFDPKIQRRTTVWRYVEGGDQILVATYVAQRGETGVRTMNFIKLWLNENSQRLLPALCSALAKKMGSQVDMIATRFHYTPIFVSVFGKKGLSRTIPDPAGWFGDPKGLLSGQDLPLVPGDGDSCIGF